MNSKQKSEEGLMFKLILVKELRDLFLSNRFIMSFVVCGLLIIVGFSSASLQFHRAQNQYESSVAENRNQIAAETVWANINHRVSIAPNPLSTLVSGVANDQGLDVNVHTQGELVPVNTRYNDQPILALFRVIDLDFIFGVVLSLFGIVFTFDAVNGEKQRGTLKLCFANALPRAQFILAKLTGYILGVSMALCIPILIGFGILLLTDVPLSSEDWIKLGLIILTGLLYFATFLSVSLAFSTFTTRPSHSFLFGLLFWIVSVMIVPRAAVIVAGRWVEVPNIDSINAQKAQLSTDLWEKNMESLNGLQLPKKGDVGQAFAAFQQKMAELSEQRQQKIDQLSQELNRTRNNARTAQRKMALALARISPTSTFSLAAMNLAGTSIQAQEQLHQSLANYQEQYTRFIDEKTENSGSSFRMVIVNEDIDTQPDPLDPSEIPAFTVANSSIGLSLSHAFIDLALLVAYTFIAIGIAFFTFLKFDLR